MTDASGIILLPRRKARILTLDIERAPASGYFWDFYTKYIPVGNLIKPGTAISFAAKWEDSKQVLFYSDFHHGHDVMVQKAWELMDEADAIVSYNGKKFDIPHLHTEFALADMGRPSPHDDIDLYLTAKSKFNFMSNKLDFIAGQLGLGRKFSHEGFVLWLKCMDGDKSAWNQMRKYNKQDVLLTEALYHKWLPWIKNHPHMGLLTGRPDGCPRCGSESFQSRGSKPTKVIGVSEYRQFCCNDCGHWFRVNTRESGATTRSIA